MCFLKLFCVNFVTHKENTSSYFTINDMMENLISAFPANITEALAIAKASIIKPAKQEITNIVICGMGGSGIGGRIVEKWIEDEINIPVNGVSAYSLPNYVNENTLVIGSSYSGNTEETLSCIEEAISKNAQIIGITSGGKLKDVCSSNGFDCIIVPGGNPPRTALAFSLVQLLNILSAHELISNKSLSSLESARDSVVSNETEIKSIAHNLAEFLKGRVGILYGETKFEPMLVRARQQFNENGKLLCWHHVIPEMNHNELVGWGGGDNRFAVVYFTSDDMHARNVKRMEIGMDVIKKKGASQMEIKAIGNSFIEQTIYLINIVDWASLYLSDLKNVDPIDIEVIDFLKSELANFT